MFAFLFIFVAFSLLMIIFGYIMWRKYWQRVEWVEKNSHLTKFPRLGVYIESNDDPNTPIFMITLDAGLTYLDLGELENFIHYNYHRFRWYKRNQMPPM